MGNAGDSLMRDSCGERGTRALLPKVLGWEVCPRGGDELRASRLCQNPWTAAETTKKPPTSRPASIPPDLMHLLSCTRGMEKPSVQLVLSGPFGAVLVSPSRRLVSLSSARCTRVPSAASERAGAPRVSTRGSQRATNRLGRRPRAPGQEERGAATPRTAVLSEPHLQLPHIQGETP